MELGFVHQLTKEASLTAIWVAGVYPFYEGLAMISEIRALQTKLMA
jgi:hypothetical protein